MKKLLALVLALLMVASFAACSKDTPASETNEETVSNKTEDKKENAEDSVTSDEETETNDDNEEIVEETEDSIENSEAEAEAETENDNTTSEETDDNSNATLGNKLLSEFKSVAGSGNALSVAEKLSSYSELSVYPMGAMEVEPGLLTGFDNAEIKGFKEGAMFAPMMGTIPFVGYVFTLEDGADVSAFISTLTANANKRWNICTEAEETVTGSKGNKVFFVMCNKSIEE